MQRKAHFTSESLALALGYTFKKHCSITNMGQEKGRNQSKSHEILLDLMTWYITKQASRLPPSAYINRYGCDRKSRAAHAQSLAPRQQATIEIIRRNLSYYCLLAPHIQWCYSSRTLHSRRITQPARRHRRGCNNTMYANAPNTNTMYYLDQWF